MEGQSRDCHEYQEHVAPFVGKTYQMVSDPRLDSLIRWGNQNNSFLVVDPNDFSQLLLPSFFKHRNFSSFIRQLNTYGFRKVDPDRWEFAHESFLRGQAHLLPSITRRRRKSEGVLRGSSSRGRGGVDGEEERLLLQELEKLQQQQRTLEDEVKTMSKRLQATERRPRQLMSFLAKVAEDPKPLLQGLVCTKQQQQSTEKKRRLFASRTTTLRPFDEVSAMFKSSRTETKPLEVGGFDLSARQTSSQPEFGLNGTSSGSSTVAFPFTLLDQGFF
ncbi:HSF-type DNA-binding [Musa troglodytarum]|uniref:HSF-type DNA-binding n=1 Tax=Musa troglodytarum TaxID=320322 RepID=A0A9E7FD23_9LILI|nr:HSF-type DNA-binding [Musa troglodytarum]